MTDLQLFPDEGVCRPPGVPETARPGEPFLHLCPHCEERFLFWTRLTLAECERCHYVWRRSGQLHHTENLPI